MKFYLLGTMRHCLLMQLVLLAVVLVSVSDVGAEPVTIRYQGTLTNVEAPLQGIFSTGDSFSGTYTYDSDSPAISPIDQDVDTGGIDFPNAISAMSFSSATYSVSAINGGINATLVESTVYFDPISGSPVGDFIPNGMTLNWDFTHSAPFDENVLTTDPVLKLPVSGSLRFSFLDSKGLTSKAEGELVSITVFNTKDDSLVAHWPLDESSGVIAHDITGNGFGGVLTRGPVWQGRNLLFDGIDDYVNVGALEMRPPGFFAKGFGIEALTLAGWVNSNRLKNCRARDCRIISKATGTAEQDHVWMLSTIKVGSQTRLRFRLKTEDGIEAETSTLIASSGDLAEGELFHAAATYDGTTMRLYKNGVEVGARAKTGTIADRGQRVWIGGNPNIAISRPWKGLISDVRVYRKALTKEELYSVIDELE